MGFSFLSSYTLVNHLHRQPTPVAAPASSLLWEVTGKGLPAPSYLFGTFHFINSRFVVEHPMIEDKLQKTSAVVGEIVFDSTTTATLMRVGVMPGQTLDQLLSPADYQKTGAYLKQISGYDIALFKALKPMMLGATLMAMEWQKSHPEQKATDPAMDAYFQEWARKNGKAVKSLETVEEQAKLLFDDLPLARQTALLMEAVNKQEENRQLIRQMDSCYRSQALECLRGLLYGKSGYQPEEIKKLLDDRNQKWMNQLPTLFQQRPTFVAVGAGHLVGEAGLIHLLRKQGYTVKPVKI